MASHRPPDPVLAWTTVIVPLVLFASVVGLVDPRPYAQETLNWALQARGQDLGNLIAVAVLVMAALRHRRGSVAAGLVWVGTLLYLVYAYLVYAFAVHLNALFLVYVAVLGLSAWALLFTVPRLRAPVADFPVGPPVRAAGVTLIATGVLFATLWLSELVPALLSGTVPPSLTEAGLIVNPIHAIDLSMVLPGFVIAGTAALSGRRHGLFWTAPWLCFSALMGTSIVAAMILLWASGFPNTLPPTIMVGVIVIVSTAVLGRFVRGVRGS
ncbi:MAG: hypothetical protein ACLGHZ_01170 [Actinomycetes bacterium]